MCGHSGMGHRTELLGSSEHIIMVGTRHSDNQQHRSSAHCGRWSQDISVWTAAYPKLGTAGPARTRGFTLLELMITLAVAAILAVLALPNFSRFIARNQIATQADGFVADLNYARAAAIRRQEDITMCPSDTSTNIIQNMVCNNLLPWSAGWIVTGLVSGNANTVLRVGAPLPSASIVATGSTNLPLDFHSDGTLGTPGVPFTPYAYRFCDATANTAGPITNNNGVSVSIGNMGAPQSSTQNQGCP